MKLHIAGDHAAFELKETLIAQLTEQGHQVTDHGTLTYDPQDDYPPVCIACAEAVAADPTSLGIVLGGSGNGEQMAANLVDGIRSALAWNEETARLARQHNNANVVAVGGRQHPLDEAVKIVEAFIAEPFSEDARHQRRIDMMTAYENNRR